MILIADSGSTKTTWVTVDNEGKKETCNTTGINPFMMETDEILVLLDNQFSLPHKEIDHIYYYGAGALPGKKEILECLFQKYFNTAHVEVHSDLLAAARSLCLDSEGVACILGTGSNSCYYDGKDIVSHVSPLGYILGDEGSGAVLGKNLLADVLKNQLSPAICKDFFDTYQTSAGEIIENVYRKPFPNRYLAQYTRFLSKNIDDPEIISFIERNFKAFFARNILQYPQAKDVPIHFTGSIALVFKDILNNVITDFGLKAGIVSKEPMDGLIKYHQTH